MSVARTGRTGSGRTRRFILQWHITDRCNLRCAHCYEESAPEMTQATALDPAQWPVVLDQFEAFLEILDRDQGRSTPRSGQLTLTGGEPLAQPRFPDLLDRIVREHPRLRIAVLTNGTLIDEAWVQRFAALGDRLAFVQVSIEGTERTHDRIRGTGSFAAAVHGLKLLTRARTQPRIQTQISFTAHAGNYHEFGAVVALARRLRVGRVWSDRLVPTGRGAALDPLSLTPTQTHRFMELMAREKRRCERNPFTKTVVTMHRALQFLVAGGRPYHCTAGDTLLTLMPNGDVYPCRRLPERVGNILDPETPLATIYQTAPLFQALRGTAVSAGCEECFYARLCRGGLRCLAYAQTGDALRADPGCWVRDAARDAAQTPTASVRRTLKTPKIPGTQTMEAPHPTSS